MRDMDKQHVYPNWVLKVVTALIMVVGSMGVLACSSAPSGVSSSSSTPTTAVSKVPLISGSPTVSPVSTIPGFPACGSEVSGPASFDFSGAVTGPMAMSFFVRCSLIDHNVPNPDRYIGFAQGTIGGTGYQFTFVFSPNFQNIHQDILDSAVVQANNHTAWGQGTIPGFPKYVAGQNTILLNQDCSGSLHLTMSEIAPNVDPTSVVTVAGTWGAGNQTWGTHNPITCL
jgi:hypothetical protein